MIKNGVVLIIISLLFFTGCVEKSSEKKEDISNDIITINDSNLEDTNFKNLKIPEHYNLRQFQGITLNFIVENNINANILSHESEAFSKLTGINVKIRAMDYDTLIRKANMDLLFQTGEYPLVYVDPYQTLNRVHHHLEVLNPYNEDPSLPRIEGFPDDFIENQTEVISYYKEKNNLYAVPFDSNTMILYYRKDIFDKYRDKFYKAMGYDWTPGSKGFTWERYIEVAKWITKNVPDKEVKYGSGQMAQQHNSIFCEFSNILAAYGGDYYSDANLNTLGLDTFNEIQVADPKFIKALDLYKEIIKAAAPESINWNWTDTANAFRNGEIAMMPNWDENSTYVENEQSKVRGKVAYAILPYGDTRSANIYGGSGIGINRYSTKIKKQAAWLYITWATSIDMQLEILVHPEGGSLPTRRSAYDNIQDYLKKLDQGTKYNSLKHMKAVLDAWKPENIYFRPKIKNFYQVEKVIISNLHEMVKNDLDSKLVSKRIYEELNEIKLNEQIDDGGDLCDEI